MSKSIVILGGGFAGIAAAKKLARKVPADFEIFLVDKNPYQTFTPNLYETSTAYIETCIRGFKEFQKLLGTATIPFEYIFTRLDKTQKTFKFVKGEVKNVSASDKKIIFQSGKLLSFDYLLIALGSETNFFGIPGLEEKANTLKTAQDALNIRNKICEIFSRKDPHQIISIVIGGGGFSGCEFAAELANALKKMSKSHPHEKEKISVTIVEASNRLLPGAKRWIQKKTKKTLKDLHVKIIFKQPVQAVRGNNLILKNRQKLYFDVLVWTAGIKGNPIIEKISKARIEKGCRIVVNNQLQVMPHENIFAAGDSIYCIEEKTQQVIPATAPGAIGQGSVAAENILRHIKGKKLISYHFKWPIFIIPVAGKNAFSDIFGIKIQGFPGWVFKELIFLRYFMQVMPISKAIKLWWQNIRLFTRND